MSNLIQLFYFYTFVISCMSLENENSPHMDGFYTDGLDQALDKVEIVYPERVSKDGSFVSYYLPHYYTLESLENRPRRSDGSEYFSSEDAIHFFVPIEGEKHHLELYPNLNFLAPGLVIERRDARDVENINKAKISQISQKQCHYNGRIIGKPDSRAALSTCYGLAGYIQLPAGEEYLIEPVKDSKPTYNKEHPHIMYKRSGIKDRNGASNCLTKGSAKEALGERLQWESIFGNQVRRQFSAVNMNDLMRESPQTSQKFPKDTNRVNSQDDNSIKIIMDTISGASSSKDREKVVKMNENKIEEDNSIGQQGVNSLRLKAPDNNNPNIESTIDEGLKDSHPSQHEPKGFEKYSITKLDFGNKLKLKPAKEELGSIKFPEVSLSPLKSSPIHATVGENLVNKPDLLNIKEEKRHRDAQFGPSRIKRDLSSGLENGKLKKEQEGNKDQQGFFNVDLKNEHTYSDSIDLNRLNNFEKMPNMQIPKSEIIKNDKLTFKVKRDSNNNEDNTLTVKKMAVNTNVKTNKDQSKNELEEDTFNLMNHDENMKMKQQINDAINGGIKKENNIIGMDKNYQGNKQDSLGKDNMYNSQLINNENHKYSFSNSENNVKRDIHLDASERSWQLGNNDEKYISDENPEKINWSSKDFENTFSKNKIREDSATPDKTLDENISNFIKDSKSSKISKIKKINTRNNDDIMVSAIESVVKDIDKGKVKKDVLGGFSPPNPNPPKSEDNIRPSPNPGQESLHYTYVDFPAGFEMRAEIPPSPLDKAKSKEAPYGFANLQKNPEEGSKINPPTTTEIPDPKMLDKPSPLDKAKSKEAPYGFANLQKTPEEASKSDPRTTTEIPDPKILEPPIDYGASKSPKIKKDVMEGFGRVSQQPSPKKPPPPLPPVPAIQSSDEITRNNEDGHKTILGSIKDSVPTKDISNEPVQAVEMPKQNHDQDEIIIKIKTPEGTVSEIKHNSRSDNENLRNYNFETVVNNGNSDTKDSVSGRERSQPLIRNNLKPLEVEKIKRGAESKTQSEASEKTGDQGVQDFSIIVEAPQKASEESSDDTNIKVKRDDNTIHLVIETEPEIKSQEGKSAESPGGNLFCQGRNCLEIKPIFLNATAGISGVSNITISDDSKEKLVEKRDTAKCKDFNAKRETLDEGAPEVDESCGATTTQRPMSCHDFAHKIFTLELMITVDYKVVQMHEDDDIENFILTIINMVSSNFDDKSIGINLSVVLVRLILLTTCIKELDSDRFNPEELLENFCTWQVLVNPGRDDHPHHHDLAIFISKMDKCQGKVMGVSYLTSVCRPDKACVICVDEGLLLANTITHQIGHSLGAEHDDGHHGSCGASLPDGTTFHMAPTITEASNTWSTCSSDAIFQFVETQGSWCLIDFPVVRSYNFPLMLPGQIYSAAQQCKLNFHMTAVPCSVGPFCNKLYCQITDKLCATKGDPPADGTFCASNMWCFHKQCVHVGRRPGAINGEWGPWTEWTMCTRSCGGGVSSSYRICNNPKPENGGRYCIGERLRHKICQTTPCIGFTESFRDLQCKRTEDRPFRGKIHNWVQYQSLFINIECALVCQNRKGDVVMRSPVVADGTPCKAGTRNVCIQGTCKSVGCDYVIDSNAKEDACGVCHGNGTECKIIQGVFDEPIKKKGLVEFLRVPKDSGMIFVREVSPSTNTMVVSGSINRVFYLNGLGTENSMAGDVAFGVAHGVYEKRGGMERVFIRGPTKEDLIFYVLFREQNKGIHYQYAMLDYDPTYIPSYQWQYLDWDPCSDPCSGGSQRARPKCVEDRGGVVDDKYCKESSRPIDIIRPCNDFPCQAKWWVSVWSDCICTGDTSVMFRSVLCMRANDESGTRVEVVKESECTTAKKPPTQRPCNYTEEDTSCGAAKRSIPEDAVFRAHKDLRRAVNPRLAFSPYSSEDELEGPVYSEDAQFLGQSSGDSDKAGSHDDKQSKKVKTQSKNVNSKQSSNKAAKSKAEADKKKDSLGSAQDTGDLKPNEKLAKNEASEGQKQEISDELPLDQSKGKQIARLNEKYPVEKSPTEKNANEKNPIEKSPSEKNPIENRLSEKNPIEKSPSEKNPSEKNPSEKIPSNSSLIEGPLVPPSAAGSKQAPTGPDDDVGVKDYDEKPVSAAAAPAPAPGGVVTGTCDTAGMAEESSQCPTEENTSETPTTCKNTCAPQPHKKTTCCKTTPHKTFIIKTTLETTTIRPVAVKLDELNVHDFALTVVPLDFSAKKKLLPQSDPEFINLGPVGQFGVADEVNATVITGQEALDLLEFARSNASDEPDILHDDMHN